jgi:hypothetical protein
MKRFVVAAMCLMIFEAKSQSLDYQRAKSLKSFVMPKSEDFKVTILDSTSRIIVDPLDQMPVLLIKGAMPTLILESNDGMPNPLFIQEEKKKKQK